MKQLPILVLLMLCSCVLRAQNIYTVAQSYFEKGEYIVADSLFRVYLKEEPKDLNAHFNLGVTRLYLGDTCTFCNEMLILRKAANDQDANKLYLSLCGTSDTLYFDKNYASGTTEKVRYMEVIEKDRCYDYKLVTVHDKKNMGKSVSYNPYDIQNPTKTDVVAVYRLYPDHRKVYTFSINEPIYKGGDAAKLEFKMSDPLIRQTKMDFNLENAVARIEYIVDKNGNIKDLTLVSANKPIDRYDDFKQRITQIVSGMPRYTPARFRDENVDFLVSDYISFW